MKIDGARLERAADEFLASRHAVVLLPDTGQPETAEVFRLRDGRLVPVAREELRYSTAVTDGRRDESEALVQAVVRELRGGVPRRRLRVA